MLYEEGGIMIFKKITDGIYKYGSTPEDAFRGKIPCSPDLIREFVVIAPFWKPVMFADSFDDIIPLAMDMAWDINAGSFKFTYIRTGIGAPRTGDTILALGLSKCKNVFFIGSAGALTSKMRIGDVIIPEYSITGDGYSRYLTSGTLKESDCFTEKVYPDTGLNNKLEEIVKNLSGADGVNIHKGRVFSIDTIFAQFAHIDEIKGYGCNCIEMETAAFFKASAVAGINAAALLQVSDNTVINKSLYSGRTKDEQMYRKNVRKRFFPKVICKMGDII